MKKLGFTITALGLIIIATSCNHGEHNRVKSGFSSFLKGGRKVESIKITDENLYLEIKYSGKVKFNEDGTGIKRISPDGFLKYLKNNDKFYAESDFKGGIIYEINEGDSKAELNEEDKNFITEMIKELKLRNDKW